MTVQALNSLSSVLQHTCHIRYCLGAAISSKPYCRLQKLLSANSRPLCRSFSMQHICSNSKRQLLKTATYTTTICWSERTPIRQQSCLTRRWLRMPKKFQFCNSISPKIQEIAWMPVVVPLRSMHPPGPGRDRIMNVFDRRAKRMQKDRAALAKDAHVYDYLKDEVAFRVADRLKDITRKFDVALDLGCGRGHMEKRISKKVVKKLFMTDLSRNMLESACVADGIECIKVHADEEFLPFRDDSLDLILSSLSLHWVNDLPGTLTQILRTLKNDGVFIGSIFGSDTLFELRCSLQLAEQEKEGGFAPHISPFTDMQDLGNLLTRAGFNMLTIDVDEVTVNYPSILELMHDLKGMGENNASWSRKSVLHRGTQTAAAAIYKDMYGNEDGSVPATFQILYMIGWKPDASQPKPAKRGSATVSLQDLDKMPKGRT